VLRALALRLPKVRLKILVHTRHAQRFNRLLMKLTAERNQPAAVTDIDAAQRLNWHIAWRPVSSS